MDGGDFILKPTGVLLTTANKVNIFGWLESVPVWRDLPYPIKGALLRALKVALSGGIAVLVTAASAGTLFPAAWGTQVAVILTAILTAADKYIREWNIEEEGGEPQPEPIPEPEPEEQEPEPEDEEPEEPVIPESETEPPLDDDTSPEESTDLPNGN
jgi:hypothetical protein